MLSQHICYKRNMLFTCIALSYELFKKLFILMIALMIYILILLAHRQKHSYKNTCTKTHTHSLRKISNIKLETPFNKEDQLQQGILKMKCNTWRKDIE